MKMYERAYMKWIFSVTKMKYYAMCIIVLAMCVCLIMLNDVFRLNIR